MVSAGRPSRRSDQRASRARRRRQDGEADPDRPPAAPSDAAHTKRIAGWSLIIVPTAIASPSRTGRSSQRQPTAKQQEQDRTDLAELHRVERTATTAPASRTISQRTLGSDRQDRDPDDERGRSQAPSQATDRPASGSRANGTDGEGERRRVEEDRERRRRLSIDVSYSGCAVEQPARPAST